MRPELTVLTPIELEHCEYLGHTIPLIAAEKAGIIKAGIPVFVRGSRPPHLKYLRSGRQHLTPRFYLPDLIETIEHRLTPHGREVTVRFSADHPVGRSLSARCAPCCRFYTRAGGERSARRRRL